MTRAGVQFIVRKETGEYLQQLDLVLCSQPKLIAGNAHCRLSCQKSVTCARVLNLARSGELVVFKLCDLKEWRKPAQGCRPEHRIVSMFHFKLRRTKSFKDFRV